jgi:hypothetical protein
MLKDKRHVKWRREKDGEFWHKRAGKMLVPSFEPIKKGTQGKENLPCVQKNVPKN